MDHHVGFQPRQPALGRVAPPTGVDEPDLAIGEPQQGVVLDMFPISPRGRDAVSEEHDGVAVAEREVIGEGRSRGGGPRKEGDRKNLSHVHLE